MSHVQIRVSVFSVYLQGFSALPDIITDFVPSTLQKKSSSTSLSASSQSAPDPWNQGNAAFVVPSAFLRTSFATLRSPCALMWMYGEDTRIYVLCV